MNCDLVQAEQDAERACRTGPMTQRLAWLASRTFAVSYGQLYARRPLVSLDESRNMVRYQRRALELLEQSLALTDADKRAEFWRDVIQGDPSLPLLGERFRELNERYAPTRPAAGGE
jgi:hypothetical protein